MEFAYRWGRMVGVWRTIVQAGRQSLNKSMQLPQLSELASCRYLKPEVFFFLKHEILVNAFDFVRQSYPPEISCVTTQGCRVKS